MGVAIVSELARSSLRQVTNIQPWPTEGQFSSSASWFSTLSKTNSHGVSSQIQGYYHWV